MSPDPDLEQRAINVIRGLAMDAPQAANSGHPGTAMALFRHRAPGDLGGTAAEASGEDTPMSTGGAAGASGQGSAGGTEA